MVSSVDQHFSQYVATTKVQEPRTEIIADMKDMVEVKFIATCFVAITLIRFANSQAAVEKFSLFWKYMRNSPNLYPQRIIFYR